MNKLRLLFLLALCVSIIGTLSADEYSRYNQIRERTRDLSFAWTPAKVKDVDPSRSDVTQDLGLLWEQARGKVLPEDKAKLPTKFSWLEYDPNSGNFPNLPAGKYITRCDYQLRCGSCWAFAAIHVFEAVYQIALKNTQTGIDMSQQILVSCSANWGCNGGWPSTTAAFLKDKGTWKESCYAYLAENGHCGDACSEYPNHAYKLSDWYYVAQRSPYADVNSVKQALYQYGPLYTSMTVYDDFRYYYVGGIYQLTPGSKRLGGHAVAIVGYDDEQQCFIGQNSWDRLHWEEEPPQPWGEDFQGDRGYFRIHYNQLTNQVGFGRSSIVYVYNNK